MKRSHVLLLAGLALGALAVTWAVEPNLLIGLRSPRALAWAGALGLTCLAVGWLTYRRAGLRWAVGLGLLPGVIATAVVVVRPIVNPRELNEAFPTPAASRSALPIPSVAPTRAVPIPTTASASKQPLAPSRAPVAPSPSTERLATGQLRGLAGHDARGTVSTYRLADGSHVIRFENVDIGGTPDPEVWVVPGTDKKATTGGTHLGHLKAEKGSFNYTLPAGFATSGYTVLVWCEQFAVEIANATQS